MQRRHWWTRQESNPHKTGCKPAAFPFSHAPKKVEDGSGIEPLTWRFAGACLSHSATPPECAILLARMLDTAQPAR